jgi:hypothetical protein
MTRVWQALALSTWAISGLHAEPAPKEFTWDPPKVSTSHFTRDFGMLDPERDEYATNLATFAANRIALAKASPESLAEARRIIALALHLSPRNRRAVVVSFQLSKGLIPEDSRGDYAPQTLARLLLTRGQLLEKQGGSENLLAARTFIQIAAEIDPKNEDAVYASEVMRLDRGEIDWSILTDPKPAENDPPDSIP